MMIGVAIVLVALFPLFYTDPYYMTIIVTAEVVLILNISWNFVLGMAGVWNFGQLAIYALGAYGAGWLMLHQTWMPAMIAILCGGLFAAGISVLLAFPTLRLFGIYTSLLTFSFAQVVQYVALNNPRGLTGGSFGYPTVPGLFPNMSQTSYLRAYYWVFAAVIVASCLVVAWLRQSHLGIALRSIRDSPGYTAARGVNPRMTRVIAFGLSGFLAGVRLLPRVRAVVHDQPDGPHADVDRRHDARDRRARHGHGAVDRHRHRHRHPDHPDRLPGLAVDDPGRDAAGDRDLRPGRRGGADLPHLQAGGRLGRGGL
jgi:ribose/xylose/arabinose/galactoside ABC-type transport system permease subunit